jgi:hypothetical protein
VVKVWQADPADTPQFLTRNKTPLFKRNQMEQIWQE